MLPSTVPDATGDKRPAPVCKAGQRLYPRQGWGPRNLDPLSGGWFICRLLASDALIVLKIKTCHKTHCHCDKTTNS